MLRLGVFLFLAPLALAVHPKIWSSLNQIEGIYTPRPSPSTPAPTQTAYGKNGYPTLSPKTKSYIEQCIIDEFIEAQFDCGNNPYAGLVRLSFHDCGTYDKTNKTHPGGCNAWMTKKCSKYDACEYTAHENNGLKMWVDPLDEMYNNAQVDGKSLSKYLSRADFWHLAGFRAVRKSSDFQVNAKYHGGRVDPDFSGYGSSGPRFSGRLPDAHSWSEMLRVAHRNDMDDITASALLGAHTLGQCHPSTSGYKGSWDPTPTKFDAKFWHGLLNLNWFLHEITSVNSQTGAAQDKTQFSLGGDNYDKSVMLFSDMGMHFDLDNAQCDVDHNEVAKHTCPLTPSTPDGLQAAIQAWADIPQTFFDDFAEAWEEMTTWGCGDSCYGVDEYSSSITCGRSDIYSCSCKQGYGEGITKWVYGWENPATPPPTSSPGGYHSTTTTKPPYHPPTTTTKPPYHPPSPTTTTKPPYHPPTTTTTKTPYHPPSTTKPPYHPPTTTTTKTPYHPPSPTTTTTKPPYHPPTTTTTKTPYHPPSTTKPPYHPPTTTRPPYTPPFSGTPSKAPPSSPVPTSTPPETTPPETTPPETTPPETTPPETTPPETTPPETTPPETTPPETTPPETTPPETTPPETTPETTTPCPTTTTAPTTTTTPCPTSTTQAPTTPLPTTTACPTTPAPTTPRPTTTVCPTPAPTTTHRPYP